MCQTVHGRPCLEPVLLLGEALVPQWPVGLQLAVLHPGVLLHAPRLDQPPQPHDGRHVHAGLVVVAPGQPLPPPLGPPLPQRLPLQATQASLHLAASAQPHATPSQRPPYPQGSDWQAGDSHLTSSLADGLLDVSMSRCAADPREQQQQATVRTIILSAELRLLCLAALSSPLACSSKSVGLAAPTTRVWMAGSCRVQSQRLWNSMGDSGAHASDSLREGLYSIPP